MSELPIRSRTTYELQTEHRFAEFGFRDSSLQKTRPRSGRTLIPEAECHPVHSVNRVTELTY